MRESIQKNWAFTSKPGLCIAGIVVAVTIGFGCNNQTTEKPQKAVPQSANSDDENRRKELASQSNSASGLDQDEKAGDKKEENAKTRRQTKSRDSNGSSGQTSRSDVDVNAILTGLGLSRSEVEALQQVACSVSPEQLEILASFVRNGGGGSSAGSGLLGRRDWASLADLAKVLENLPPENIRQGLDNLCKKSSQSSRSTN